jgi:pyruvate dehydrogenase E1 component alpha subunit
MSSKTADGRVSARGAQATTPRRDGETRIAPHVPKRTIDLGELELLQVVDATGRMDESLDPKLSEAELLRVHRAMVLTRKLDVRMLAMQRQGEMGTFAPGLGQEATQIGQIEPLRASDWFSPSYRSFGAQLWRGWTIDGLMLLWDGFFEGFAVPEGINDLPFSIVIGSHPPMAAGIAMAMKTRGDDSVVLTNFGDGALSQGPVLESLNFAAVFKAPIVFVVENNGWAISVPTEKQSATKHLAARGHGFGIPAITVDGNDVLAMIVACREAVDRARRGEGPTLVEAVTYRMEVHTTADNPKVYRRDEDVEPWKAKDPIARFEKHLVARGLLDEARIEAIAAECEHEVIEGREKFRARAKAAPREVFDFMFAELPPELEAQKREYLAKLDRMHIE